MLDLAVPQYDSNHVVICDMQKLGTTFSNRVSPVEEIVTEATLDALNAALSEHGIDAERIISILPVPGQTTAFPKPPQLRVLFRAS